MKENVHRWIEPKTMNEESILVVHEVVEKIKLQLLGITQQINSLELTALSLVWGHWHE